VKPRLIIIGAGGHARVLVALARHAGWEIAGVLDRVASAVQEMIDGVAVIGTFDEAARLHATGVHHAALALGDNDARAEFFARLTTLGFTFPVLRHPTAIIEPSAWLGDGTVVCAGAIVGVQAAIGRNVIINSGAIIDHEAIVGDHAHLAPGSRVAGRVRVGAGAMLGIGSCVREKIAIGARTLVGAGSVVVTDLPDGVVAFGHPARVVRPRTP